MASSGKPLPGSSIGGDVITGGRILLVGDDATGRRYRGFLSFNTASLPDSAIIVMAQVKVKQSSPPAGNPFGTQGNLLTDLAAPYFGAGLGLTGSDWQAGATVSPAGTFVSTPASNWYRVVLNPTARLKINKLGTTQFRLRFALKDHNATADNLILISGNAASPADWPLTVVYFNP